MINKATGLGPEVHIHKADIVDPDRFKNFLSTLEREKVRRAVILLWKAHFQHSLRAAEALQNVCGNLFTSSFPPGGGSQG